MSKETIFCWNCGKKVTDLSPAKWWCPACNNQVAKYEADGSYTVFLRIDEQGAATEWIDFDKDGNEIPRKE